MQAALGGFTYKWGDVMRIFLLVALLLTGCANQNFNKGVASFNRNEFASAYNFFLLCVNETQDSGCMFNVGMSAYRSPNQDEAEWIKHQEEAVRWYTLAARYGNQNAISQLIQLGKPVPAADLVQQQTHQPTYQPPQQQQRQPVYSAPRETQTSCGWQLNKWVCNSQPTGIDASIYNNVNTHFGEELGRVFQPR